MEASVLELGNLIQGFKLCCQTEGKSPKTIEWYTTFLNRFLAFLEFENYPTDVAQINEEVIRAFILYLQVEAKTPRSKKPLSSATVQGYVRTLRVFFSWVVREEYLPSFVLNSSTSHLASRRPSVTASAIAAVLPNSCE